MPEISYLLGFPGWFYWAVVLAAGFILQIRMERRAFLCRQHWGCPDALEKRYQEQESELIVEYQKKASDPVESARLINEIDKVRLAAQRNRNQRADFVRCTSRFLFATLFLAAGLNIGIGSKLVPSLMLGAFGGVLLDNLDQIRTQVAAQLDLAIHARAEFLAGKSMKSVLQFEAELDELRFPK